MDWYLSACPRLCCAVDSDVEIVGTSSGDDGVEIVHERDAPVPAGDGALPMPGAPALSAPARTGAHSNESTDNEEEGGGGDEQQQQQEDDAGAGAGGGSKKKRKAECPALEGVELEDPNAELVLGECEAGFVCVAFACQQALSRYLAHLHAA